MTATGSAMRALYSAAGAATGAAAAARGLFASGGDAEWLRERCGRWPRRPAGAWIWIHGASVGETEISLAVARALAPHIPGTRIVVTAATPTGRARARLEASVESRAFPIDYAPFVKRVLGSS